MGALLSALSGLFAGDARLEVAFLGLENSGKTTLAEFLCQGHKAATFPTVGLNVRMVKKKGVTIKMWDMSGQERFRRDWPRYIEDTDCIVFCVDAAEMGRIHTVADELHRIVAGAPELLKQQSVPLLVCLTKYDLSPRLSVEDAVALLRLERLPKSVSWTVVPCSCVSGHKIGEIIDWLVKHKRASKR